MVSCILVQLEFCCYFSLLLVGFLCIVVISISVYLFIKIVLLLFPNRLSSYYTREAVVHMVYIIVEKSKSPMLLRMKRLVYGGFKVLSHGILI